MPLTTSATTTTPAPAAAAATTRITTTIDYIQHTVDKSENKGGKKRKEKPYEQFIRGPRRGE